MWTSEAEDRSKERECAPRRHTPTCAQQEWQLGKSADWNVRVVGLGSSRTAADPLLSSQNEYDWEEEERREESRRDDQITGKKGPGRGTPRPTNQAMISRRNLHDPSCLRLPHPQIGKAYKTLFDRHMNPVP